MNHRLRLFKIYCILACYKRCIELLKEIFRIILSTLFFYLKDFLNLSLRKLKEIRKTRLMLSVMVMVLYHMGVPPYHY